LFFKKRIWNVINLFLDLGQVTGLEQAIISLSDTLDLLPANPKLEAIQNRLIAERLSAGIFEDEESVPSQSILKYLLATV
jgi:hypothetical protein